MNRIRGRVKKLLKPYPTLWRLGRRMEVLGHRILKPVIRPWYVRHYRTYWERDGVSMLERHQAMGFLHQGGLSEQQAEFMVEQMVVFAPRRILEFGCGYGRLLKPLSDHLNDALICGYDISRSNLINARAYLSRSPVALVQGDGRFGLPFKDNAFDVVFTFFVLVHIPPPFDMAVRREFLRVAAQHVVHVESIGQGINTFGYDNAAIYRSMGCAVEERSFPLGQDERNPMQYIVVQINRG